MTRHRYLRTTVAACLVLSAAACGQKGPLFLPGDPSHIQTEIPPEAGGLPQDGAPGDDAGNNTGNESGNESGDDADEDSEKER